MIWILLLLAITSQAFADVTREQKSSVRFMGTSETVRTDHYSGDKHSEFSNTRWTRGFMKTMTGGKPVETGTIVRLDKELVWTLDPKKETYQEMTFAEYREMLKKALAEGQQPEEGDEEAAAADSVGEEMYEWTTSDKSDPNPKTINGWTCRNLRWEILGVNKHNENDKVLMVIDLWNSEEISGTAEIADFNLRYFKALGLDEIALTPGLTAAFLLYRQQLDSLMAAAQKAPGENVQSLLEMQRYRPKGKALGKQISEGAAEEVMGKLPFGKKKKKEEPVVYEWKIRFSAASELLRVTADAVDAARFEIPAGYKLKKSDK